MGSDVTGKEDDALFEENPLESALADAGFDKVSPEKIARIHAILSEPEKGAPGAAKPGAPAGAGTPPVGGMVPKGMPPPSGGMI
jgi:hypothetical protein